VSGPRDAQPGTPDANARRASLQGLSPSLPHRIEPAHNAEPFTLDGDAPPPRPKLPGHVVLREDQDAVIDALLADLFVHARNCVRVFGDFQLAIAFWPEVNHVIRRLMCDLNYREFPWSRTRVWSVDELDVPTDDPRHRGELLRGLIVAGADVPTEQVHPFDFAQPDPTLHYDAMLREHLGWREKGQDRLDFVLVPQLPDGNWGGVVHDESAPPHAATTPTTTSPAPARLTIHLPPTPHRPATLAMSARLVRAARFVAILATGEHVAPGIRHWSKRFSISPTGALATQDSAEVRWYCDHEACR
jgi:6-phosphogluconolactonase/glucosamine-6-phosphate isomerase/deaminase